MKNMLMIFLCLNLTQAFAQEVKTPQPEQKFVVDKIDNSCSSWGHSIIFRFKDNSVDKNIINITVFEWKHNIEEKKFYFSEFSSSGNMSLCKLKYDNFLCENKEGYISLNKPYKSFKTGDYIDGEVFVEQKPPIKFNFTYTIPDISKNKQIICKGY